jgi:hypothetical protein
MRFEDRTTTLHCVGITTHHHQQTPSRRRGTAAADRCIENRNALIAGFIRNSAASVGVYRAVHRDHPARLHSSE